MRANELAAFMRLRRSCARDWSWERLVAWCQWYIDRDLVAVVHDGVKVVGVALARGLNRLEDYEEHYTHVDDGWLMYVEWASADVPGALRKVWEMGVDRFPSVKYVAFGRASKNRRPKIHRVDRMTRLLKGVK